MVTGGIIRQVYRTVPVRCLPDRIPMKLEIDITHLGDGRARRDAGPEARRPASTVRLPPSRRSSRSSRRRRSAQRTSRRQRRVRPARRLPVQPLQQRLARTRRRHPPRRRRRRQLPRRTPRRSSVVRSACADSTAREERRAQRPAGGAKARDSAMFLIVGLGNPGKKYEANRHNVGFMAVDALAREVSGAAWKEKFSGRLARGELDGQSVGAPEAHDVHESLGRFGAARDGVHSRSPSGTHRRSRRARRPLR